MNVICASEIYVIEYDNERLYEEYYHTPILATETESRAGSMVAEINAWLAATRAAYQRPVLKQYESEKRIDDWENMVMALTPPYGSKELLDDIRLQNEGKVMYYKLPFIHD